MAHASADVRTASLKAASRAGTASVYTDAAALAQQRPRKCTLQAQTVAVAVQTVSVM
jgi:hypothetical protein